MKKFNALFAAILAGAFLVMHVHAADETKKEKKSLVTINADKMHYNKEKGCMIVDNNVVVKLDENSLMADKVIAYQGTTADGKKDFTKIVATGNVVIKTPDRTLLGKKGVWERNKKIIRVTGDPVVKLKSGQEVKAEVIKYDLVLGKCTFEGAAKAQMSISDDDNFDLSGF